MDQKLSALVTISAVDRAVDLLYIVDVSAGSSNKTTVNQLLGISGAPVGDTDSQTLSGKALTTPTISSPVLSGTISGTYTFGGTPTFPASVVTLTGSQTLTGKILTSPTINTPTITNATITADSIAGFSTANTGTIYGVSVTAGVVASAAILNAVNTAAIQTSAVTGSKIANYNVVRQNDTTNTTETTARILTGWGVIAYNTGSTFINETVTFNSAFTSPPIITTCFAGDHGTLQTYGSNGNLVEALVQTKPVLPTTTGFTIYLHKPSGGNFSAGFGFYTWMAVGV